MPQRLPLGVGGDRELGGGLRGAEPAGGLHAGQHLRAVGGAEGAGGRLRQWGRRKCPPPRHVAVVAVVVVVVRAAVGGWGV